VTQKRPPTRSRQQPTCRREEEPIGRRQLGTTCLPAKDRQLMSQHDDLQLLELGRARMKQDEPEQAREGHVAERPEHEQLLGISGTGARLYGRRVHPEQEPS
jgi:hypothetical protein